MEQTRSTQRFAAVVAKQRQVEALRSAEAVVGQHAQWVLSHLSAADRDLIRSVTGEVITPETTSASMFAMTLAESRVSAAPAPAPTTNFVLGRGALNTQHEHLATFASMRAMIGGNAVGRALDLEA